MGNAATGIQPTDVCIFTERPDNLIPTVLFHVINLKFYGRMTSFVYVKICITAIKTVLYMPGSSALHRENITTKVLCLTNSMV
jgi:hypothetical protein